MSATQGSGHRAEPAEVPVEVPADKAPADAKRDRRLGLERAGMPIVFLITIVIFTLALPNLFLTSGNINAMLSAQAVPLVLALGVLFPLRAGQFDLSIAAVMVLSGCIIGVLTVQKGWGLAPAIAVAVIACAIIGLVNGTLAVVWGLNSFVVTLGTSAIIGGLSYAITDSASIQPLTDEIVTLATTRLLGQPALVWYAWILAVAVWVVLEWTPFGRYLLFIGGSKATSELIGIPAHRYGVMTFLIASVFASFAGILLAGSINTVNPTIGGEFLLTPYAAAFLGAAAIQIGRFNALGTVLAVYLVSSVQTGLILLGSPTWLSAVFEGGILLVAIGFSRLVRKPA